MAALLCIMPQIMGQDITRTYKLVDTTRLVINIYYPLGEVPDSPTPAIVFFFGGGWVRGDPSHFHKQCEYLSSKGIVALAADYRVKNRHGTTPLESLADAKSSMRWIKVHADELGIDPDMIVAAGGSAGGYLALALATINGFNDPADDTTVSTMPAALVLFNPVVNTWKEGYGMERLGEHAFALSPLHQIDPGLPPTLIFHGEDDNVVDFSDILAFRDIAITNRDICIVASFPGEGHGFFNIRNGDDTYFRKTLLETEKFLSDREFLPANHP